MFVSLQILIKYGCLRYSANRYRTQSRNYEFPQLFKSDKLGSSKKILNHNICCDVKKEDRSLDIWAIPKYRFTLSHQCEYCARESIRNRHICMHSRDVFILSSLNDAQNVPFAVIFFLSSFGLGHINQQGTVEHSKKYSELSLHSSKDRRLNQ